MQILELISILKIIVALTLVGRHFAIPIGVLAFDLMMFDDTKAKRF
jgi:hypothetical protein